MRKDSNFSSFDGTKGLEFYETGAFVDENEKKRTAHDENTGY